MNNPGRKRVAVIVNNLLLASLALLLVSCAWSAGQSANPADGSVGQDPGSLTPAGSIPAATRLIPTPAGSDTPPQQERARPYPTLPPGVERIETPQQPPLVGEVPADLLASIFEHLSSLLKIDSQEIEVVRGEAIIWSDGSLGCPEPGDFYTQAPVSGYWVVLQVDVATYDYRASEKGYFFLCESPPLQGLPDSSDK